MACTVCGDPRTVARDRCGTCWKYNQRTSRDRSQRLISRLTQRDIDKGRAR